MAEGLGEEGVAAAFCLDLSALCSARDATARGGSLPTVSWHCVVLRQDGLLVAVGNQASDYQSHAP